MNTQKDNRLLVVDLDGALDSQTSSDFKSWVEEKILDGYHFFALDFSHLEYLSSRGIGVLLEIQKILRKREGETVLYSLNEETKNLLQFFHIGDEIRVFETKEEANSYLSRKGESGSSAGEYTVSGRSLEIKSTEEVIDGEVKGKPAAVLEESEKQEHSPASDSVEAVEDTVQSEGESDQALAETITDDDSPAEFREIFCQNCGVKLRISQPGKYICPSCRFKFTVAR